MGEFQGRDSSARCHKKREKICIELSDMQVTRVLLESKNLLITQKDHGVIPSHTPDAQVKNAYRWLPKSHLIRKLN